MRFLAITLLAVGTIAASVALAPIPRMQRLFEGDLVKIGAAVAASVDGAFKEAEAATQDRLNKFKTTLSFVWVTPQMKMNRLAADLDAVKADLKAREQESMVKNTQLGVDKVADVLKAFAALDEANGETEKTTAKKGLKGAMGAANQRIEMLVRQLNENLGKAYLEEFKSLKVLGRSTTNRRDALVADLASIEAFLKAQHVTALTKDKKSAIAAADESIKAFDEGWEIRTDQNANRWENPVWWLFAVGCGAMLVGVFLNQRLTKQAAEAEAEKARVSGGDIGVSIHGLVDGVRQLNSDLDTLDDATLHSRLGGLIDGPLFDLLEAREVLTPSLGMKGYAISMSTLASAERQLNRAWCALTDEYPDEGRRCVGQAQKYLDSFHTQVAGAIGDTQEAA